MLHSNNYFELQILTFIISNLIRRYKNVASFSDVYERDTTLLYTYIK